MIFAPALRRRLTCGFAVALLCVLPSLSAQADTIARPTLPLWNAATLTQVCNDGLVELQRQVDALANLPLDAVAIHADTDTKTFFPAWNALQIRLEDIENPVYLLNNVSPDPAVRAAAESCLLEYNRFGSALYQNAAIYQRVRAVVPRDAVDAKLKKDLLEAFEDTGVALPVDKQARMKQILERLELIRQEFDRNIRDNDTRLSFTPTEVVGLPPAYLERAARDAQGNYLLGFGYPEYVPFMENAEDEAARRRYQFAFVNRGGPRNLELLDEVVALRHKMAGLYGLPSYADFVIRRRMAGTPAAVRDFLAEVQTQVRQVELDDLAELRQAKVEHTGKPLAQVQLQRWDVSYYQERLKRERYSVDQEALRRYFPSEAAFAWAMDISAQLYGIEFRAAGKAVAVWHPEVRYYDVIDGKTGELLGGIYLDPYPREGKYSHAAAFGVRGASRLAGRTPISVLVTNFDRQGLNFNELETLVHEFGHVMHGVLSRTRYVDHAGTRVETDFVEAPSQMYEEWAHRLESVGRIAGFCADRGCKPVDAEMMQRLNAARNFGRGIHYARQHLYASYDMALYGPQPGAALAVWQRMEAATPLGHTPDTAFPGQFSHIIRGYGAGYYGYMWSEVLALDMLSQYGDNLMNPAVGQRFRREILERGGERSGAEMARNFLGRAPSPQAFFAEIAGRRQQ
ncbi:Thimet oligopeptidase [Sterolibacterium denitrificans]|uniref:Zn-dependent oligopeptidase n=2 Tax=Sterolibacterium denitrificans TaxID=157592 RepID=A0A656Z805_9PROT|nr:M3 family metallopeptidase [Sterolibacterium denitrificans]KYC29183.1 Zn-dependent oligopeptidase [Sterolibacterium denitrificans]SMB29490.1 Thimet oligopeptidase [Sterolibacterium denitrificans]